MDQVNSRIQTIWDHIDDLRSCVIKSVIAIGLSAIVVYRFIDEVMLFIVKPVGNLVFTGPADAFVAQLTLIFLGGFILALPVILYQIWSFVALGLQSREKRYILLYAPLSLVFFVSGILFANYVALPFSIRFLMGFSSGWLVPMITIKNYISFYSTMVLAFGVIFELPIVMIFLTAIGIATPAYLSQKRRHAIIIILVVSAVITPPDLVTLLIMTCPLVFLYEIGVIASRVTYRKKYSLEN